MLPVKNIVHTKMHANQENPKVLIFILPRCRSNFMKEWLTQANT